MAAGFFAGGAFATGFFATGFWGAAAGFEAGVDLVWYVDSSARTVRVYHSLEAVVTLTEADNLDGEQLLPGFRLSVRD